MNSPRLYCFLVDIRTLAARQRRRSHGGELAHLSRYWPGCSVVQLSTRMMTWSLSTNAKGTVPFTALSRGK